MPRVVALLLVGMIITGGVAGCGRSGGTQALPPSAVPAAPADSPSAVPSSPDPASPSLPAVSSAAGFPTAYAVPCAGQPSPDQVLALLRTSKALPANATATVTSGPLCSGTWQFTALDVTGLGPLQAITRGTAPALELITAGTDICTTAVKTQAPAGILAITRC